MPPASFLRNLYAYNHFSHITPASELSRLSPLFTMGTPSKKSFRTNLFSPDNITSVEDIENALFELQSIFTEQNYEDVLDELLQTPFLIELVLSGTFLVFSPPSVRTHQNQQI